MEVPFKPTLSLEDTVILVEKLTKQLSSDFYDITAQPAIFTLSMNLKHHGPSLESSHRKTLDNLQEVLQFACRDKKLDLVSRVHILEIIELRTLKWAPSDHVTNYYKKKLLQINTEMFGDRPPVRTPPATMKNTANDLHICSSSRLNANAHEFLFGTSHLFNNMFNQSTGHNDLLSPQLLVAPSPIKFQQPPLGHWKASRSSVYSGSDHKKYGNDIGGDSTGQYTVTFKTTGGDITLSSHSIEIFHTAKNIVKEKLAHQILPENSEPSVVKSLSSSSTGLIQPTWEVKINKPELTYNRSELMELANSPLCVVPPHNWDQIVNEVPSMVKSLAVEGGANDHMEKAMADLAKRTTVI